MTQQQKVGSSLYYATDKNIRDALNEHKVDSSTLSELFHGRNTIVSGDAPRGWLADYFSTLNHDFYDHRSIAAKLGVTSRRERVTSVRVSGVPSIDGLVLAIKTVKEELEGHGEVVNIIRTEGRIVMRIDYSVIDYRRSEFNQVQEKDGEIEFQKEGDVYIVRNTHNDHVDAVRDLVLSKVETPAEQSLNRSVISLQNRPDPGARSNFFYRLANELKDYSLKDVTDVFVHRPGDESAEEDGSPQIVRVTLRGTGVTQSEQLSRLAKEGFYIVKIGWRFAENLGKGFQYAAEALFTDPVGCTGFSYILLGVHESDGAGLVSKNRRTPNRIEITHISSVIENCARRILDDLNGDLGGTPGD
jgi:hypothetical protein